MPIVPHVHREEPNDGAEIWRFMDIVKFRDLMASEELYFHRLDLFKKDDVNEGLPSDDYVRSVRSLVRYDLTAELELNHTQASNRQFSESYFITCWHLFDGERLGMWKRYGCFAIRSCYTLLKQALDGMIDTVHLGLVRYGDGQMRRYNVLEFIYHKRSPHEGDREIRAALFSPDPLAGMNRHLNELNFPNREPLDDVNRLHDWVPECKRRRIDLKALVTGIVVGPWAKEEECNEVKLWIKVKNFKCPVTRSELTPTPKELEKFRT
jgi:hypothetical protein